MVTIMHFNVLAFLNLQCMLALKGNGVEFQQCMLANSTAWHYVLFSYLLCRDWKFFKNYF